MLSVVGEMRRKHQAYNFSKEEKFRRRGGRFLEQYKSIKKEESLHNMVNNKEREKGRRLLADGCALVDTSGRTKEVREKSVLALASKGFNFTIIMYSSEKKKVFRKLEKKYGVKRTRIIVHAVKLYYALKDYLEVCPSFYICCEGFDGGSLKHHLKQLLNIKYHEKKINIEKSLSPMFGKKNIADRLAREVNKKGKKPTFILKENHFKNLGLL